MKRIVFISFLLIDLFVIPSCQEQNPGQKIGKEVGCEGASCQFFSIPEGSVLTYTAGSEIVAQEGIDIAGTLIIKSDDPEDFKITTLTGDITISGSIVFDSTNRPSSGGRVAATGNGSDGRSLVIESVAGNLWIEATANIQAEDGASGADRLIGTTGFPEGTLTGVIKGIDGSKGGHIKLNAPNGNISLPTVHEVKGVLFKPGNGGDGGSIVLDDANFLPAEGVKRIEINGGNGGHSGSIELNTEEVIGMWSTSDLQNEAVNRFFISGGFGGKGGDVEWVLNFTHPGLTLDGMTFNGGTGGDGMLLGGSGGYAFCFITEAINPLGKKITEVVVAGGNGGNIVPAAGLAMYTVRAGDGGAFAVHGVRGWDGGKDPQTNIVYKDGAEGGDVSAYGGNGGDIKEGVTALYGVAGDGSLTALAQESFVQQLASRYDAPENFELPFFGVSAGSGGDGDNGCMAQSSGGNGGKAGDVHIQAGDGGKVYGDILNTRDGKGGNIWWHGTLKNGKGGNGLVAGQGAAQSSSISADPGLGSEAGQLLRTQSEAADGMDGQACSETCLSGGIQTGYKEVVVYNCNETITTKYYSTRRISGTLEILVSAQIDKANGTLTWNEGDGAFLPQWSSADISNLTAPFHAACVNGALYVPGSGSTYQLDTYASSTCPGGTDRSYIKIMMTSSGCFLQYAGKECACQGQSIPTCTQVGQ